MTVKPKAKKISVAVRAHNISCEETDFLSEICRKPKGIKPGMQVSSEINRLKSPNNYDL